MSTQLYPPLWRRFAAMVYDCLLLFAVSMAYGGFSIAINKIIFQSTNDNVTGLLFQIGWLLACVGFFCYFWRRGGQTLGMRAWRLKLVRQDGLQTITYWQCMLRCFFATLSLLLFGIGYWWTLVDADHRALHDRLTKTQVLLIPKG